MAVQANATQRIHLIPSDGCQQKRTDRNPIERPIYRGTHTGESIQPWTRIAFLIPSDDISCYLFQLNTLDRLPCQNPSMTCKRFVLTGCQSAKSLSHPDYFPTFPRTSRISSKNVISLYKRVAQYLSIPYIRRPKNEHSWKTWKILSVIRKKWIQRR